MLTLRFVASPKTKFCQGVVVCDLVHCSYVFMRAILYLATPFALPHHLPSDIIVGDDTMGRSSRIVVN